MKKILSVLLIIVFVFSLASCGGSEPDEGKTESSGVVSDTVQTAASRTQSDVMESESQTQLSTGDGTTTETDLNTERSNILVVYFSRTGEQYSVGTIDEGNTAIVAKMAAEKTNADIFEILPETDYYPYTYRELTDVAKKEQNEKARPAIKGDLPDMSGYDTVFIGAPVWWGDWPMIMYTFFESADLSGKKLIPFSTHEGSGLSGFDKKLAAVSPGGEVLAGLAVRGADCQNDKNGVDKKVDEWLKKLGY